MSSAAGDAGPSGQWETEQLVQKKRARVWVVNPIKYVSYVLLKQQQFVLHKEE